MLPQGGEQRTSRSPSSVLHSATIQVAHCFSSTKRALSFHPFGVLSVRLLLLSTTSTSLSFAANRSSISSRTEVSYSAQYVLVGSTNCKIKQVIVDLWKAADKIAASQDLFYTEDLADLLTLTRRTVCVAGCGHENDYEKRNE